MHRQIHLSPSPVRALALALGFMGLMNLLLGACIARNIAVSVINHTSMPHLDGTLVHTVSGALDLLLALTPLPLFLGSGTLSLWIAYVAFVGRKLQHGHLLVTGTLLLLCLNTPLIWSVIISFSVPAPQYSSGVSIPNAALFARYGVVGYRAPGQPAQPIIVDRILSDETTTYVQYRIWDEAHDGRLEPVLFDQQGNRYDAIALPFFSLQPDQYWQQLMPWHPAISLLVTFPPLRPHVHVVSLRFMDRSRRLVETVRVPVSTHAEAAYQRFTTVHAHGLTMKVVLTGGLAMARLMVIAEIPAARVSLSGLTHLSFDLPHVGTQHAKPLQGDSICHPLSDEVARCDAWMTFTLPAWRPHLTLAIQGMTLSNDQGAKQYVPYPLRLSFVMPYWK